MYSNDKRGHSQKAEREIYALHILYRSINSPLSSVHILLRVADVSYLVFGEDPSISIVKEK